MDFLFGADMSLPVRFFLAFVIVLALIGGTAFLVRRFGSSRLGGSASRGRQPRLAVIDAAAVDGRRRLVLIRRDNVEHLLMIGGPTDVVVEANIMRAAAPAREAPPQRPQAAPTDTLPRAVPLGEAHMWPLQPAVEPAPSPPSLAAPPPRPHRPPMVDEPMQWQPEPPVPPPMPPMPARRHEPRMEPRPEPRPADPLAGLASELSRHPVPPPEAPAPSPRARPARERDFGRLREPERARSVPPPVPPMPAPAPAVDEPPAANADQNLADMAHRLEAALRRPKPPEPRAPERSPEPAPRHAPAMERPAPPAPAMEPDTMQDAPAPEPVDTMREVPPPPRLAPRNPNAAMPNPASPSAPASTAAPAGNPPQRSVYDSLEQEMASLLGRPKN